MISFDAGEARFSLRVVGVAVEAGHVLLHRTEGEAFWTLPGGRAELMETAQAALAREMREEMGVVVAVGRLLWIVEGFFTYDDRAWHELSLLFQIALPVEAGLGPAVGSFTGSEDFFGDRPLPLIFRWFPVENLASLELYPPFLRAALQSPPAAPAHVIDDRSAQP
jgi:ADP-ribose pyrophosphatase YjhB (NUDIX family)